ncbi:MAG: deoxyribose-phosphate aldolase [Tissierellales bacterium]|jgi:deoxyribose-phosphate aldolase|nr:deoxyribose-phosphate aldolase [Tissierellales bacterium]HCX04597.1 deoxyribose-phosphate aldolase [Clostridiales bacterium]
MSDLGKYIDHTILKPEAKKSDVRKICEEALEYKFKAVCVNPLYVKFASEILKNSEVLVATVVGFPLGNNVTKVKELETQLAIEDGADEIDMVVNIPALKDKDYDLVKKDIEAVVKASKDKIVKVIIETCLLTKDEIARVSELIVEAGADFVKTSTGFNTGGAELEDIRLIKSIVKDKAKIKASGGIRTKEKALKMIEAGADRIGASSSIKIVEG